MRVEEDGARKAREVTFHFKTSLVSGFSCRTGLSARGGMGIVGHEVLIA
jgi:hypothetical protein